MNSLPTRFLCAVLSMVGAACLTALSTSTTAFGGHATSATVIAAAAASSVRHG